MAAQRRTLIKEVTLDEDDVAWFNEHFPKASVNGICSMLFKKFREVTQHTPQYYADLAAREMNNDLARGVGEAP